MSNLVECYCRICSTHFEVALGTPARLRERSLRNTPSVCVECRTHLMSIKAKILDANMTAAAWAYENAKELEPASAYQLSAYGRREGKRVECPFCLDVGSAGFGYLMQEGLKMHLKRCFVLDWMQAEEIMRSMRRREQRDEAERRSEERSAAARIGKDSTTDQLYLIANKRARLVKIGVSKNPVSRMRQLQNTNGEPLALVSVVQLSDAYEVEKRLHGRLSQFRQRGEWFVDSPQVREAFNGVRQNEQAA